MKSLSVEVDQRLGRIELPKVMRYSPRVLYHGMTVQINGQDPNNSGNWLVSGDGFKSVPVKKQYVIAN